MALVMVYKDCIIYGGIVLIIRLRMYVNVTSVNTEINTASWLSVLHFFVIVKKNQIDSHYAVLISVSTLFYPTLK